VSPIASSGSSEVRDPQAAAQRFLRMIYDSTPNIDRLGSVFQSIYRSANNHASAGAGNTD
jgi:hypothetical protein